MKLAPKIVSGRVVKTSMLVAPVLSDGTSSNSSRSPSDLPIQLRCMTRTFSGQPSRPSSADNSSSE